ncbi:MAG: FG-GAP repeat domain-containing protein [Myxococcaceae bacterium]
MNSDGRPDILVPGDGVQHRLLLGGAGGVFSYATMKTIPEQSYCANDSLALDIEKDGDLDLVIGTGCKFPTWCSQAEPANCRSDGVRIWLNDGAGGYTDGTTTRFPAFPWNAVSVTAVDFDKDGNQDLVVGTSSFNSTGTTMNQYGVRLYKNSGAGVFTDVTYPRMPFESYFANSVTAIDIDKDGAMDLYVTIDRNCGCSNGSNRLYINTGNGYFLDVTNQLPFKDFACNTLRTRSASVGDFNGDTWPDLYVGGEGQNRMFFNAGGANPGFFNDVTASNIPNVSDNTTRVLTGDMNNDTRPDLFVCNSGAKHVNLDNASGVLSDVSQTNWPAETQPYPYPAVCSGGPVGPLNSLSCDLVDVDADGDLDVFAAGAWTGNMNMRNRLFMNVGAANFVDKTLQSVPFDSDNTYTVTGFKANADVRPDLFIGNCGQPRLYLNQ